MFRTIAARAASDAHGRYSQEHTVDVPVSAILAPLLEEIAEEHADKLDVVKLDIDADRWGPAHHAHPHHDAVRCVPYPALLAITVALLDLVPVAGSIIGGVVVSLVALTVSVPTFLGTVIFFVAYRFLEDYLLVPKIIGSVVKVPALVTVVAGRQDLAQTLKQ